MQSPRMASCNLQRVRSIILSACLMMFCLAISRNRWTGWVSSLLFSSTSSLLCSSVSSRIYSKNTSSSIPVFTCTKSSAGSSVHNPVLDLILNRALYGIVLVASWKVVFIDHCANNKPWLHLEVLLFLIYAIRVSLSVALLLSTYFWL